MASNNVINAPIPFSVPNGGTGNSTLTTPYGVLTAGTTATGPVQTVSPGTAGQVLTSAGASAAPTFQIAPGAVLANATASSSATVSFNNVFSSAFEVYLCVFENYLPATDGQSLLVQFGTGSTPTYQTTGYFYTQIYAGSGSSLASFGTSSASSIAFFGDYNAAPYQANGYFYIFNVNQTSSSVSLAGMCTTYDSSALTAIFSLNSGSWSGASPVTSLRFMCGSGNIATGKFYIYGVSL